MTTYNTGNPLGSAAAKDLYDNAQNLDSAVNDPTKEVWDDRFGKKRKTWLGIEKEAERAITSFGYVTLDSFEDGTTISLPNQVLRWESNGEYYRWDGSIPKVVLSGSTPATAGGIGTGLWIAVGDAALRSDLASKTEGRGASLVGTSGGSDVQRELDAFKSTSSGEGAALIGVEGGSNLQDIFNDPGISGLKSIGSTLISKILMYDDNGALWDKGETGPTSFIRNGCHQISGVFEGQPVITVGEGGDFSTLNSAVAFASLFKPKYLNANSFGLQNKIEIQILSGFVVTEQVVARQIDLSHIRITSVDATVKVNVATDYWWMYGEFGAVLPIIATTFDLQGIGYDGVALKFGSKVIFEYGHGPKSGIINAKNNNVFLNTGSHGIFREGLFTGAGVTGIHFEKACTGCAREADVSSCGSYGVRLINGSSIDVYGLIAKNITAGYSVLAEVGSTVSGYAIQCDNSKVGLRASNGSTIIAPASSFASMVGSTDPWINASDGSKIVAPLSTGSGGSAACLASTGSNVDVQGVNGSSAGFANGQFRVLSGGILTATGTTGSLSKTANAIDANGIIFK